MRKAIISVSIVMASLLALALCFTFILKPAIVNAAEEIFGDLNYDEAVNSRDISILQRIVLGIYEAITTEPPSEKATPNASPTETPTEAPAKTPTPSFGPSFTLKTCSVFHRVCCIGDSVTAGHIEYGYAQDGTPAYGVRLRRNEDYAWPAYLAKITGNEYINLGISGATVYSWLESATFDSSINTIKVSASWKDKDPVSGEYVKDSFEMTVNDTDTIGAYLIGLGMNDTYLTDGKCNLPLGTIEDIGTDKETFYAAYSRLIEKIHEVSPQAKIFVQTMLENMSDERLEYNEAIRYIAKYYREKEQFPIPVHVLDLYNYRQLYKVDSIDDDKFGGHWSPVSYQQFAELLTMIWSEYINTHVTQFQDVHLVPTK